VTRVIRAATALVAAAALSAMFLATQPTVIVVAPWPAAPMRMAPDVTTPEPSSDQIEEAVISSITRSEFPTRRTGSGEPELK
jgi:Spy/CpxP family protein refolding chaperone